MVGVARAPAALAAQRRKMQALREAREAKREAAAAAALQASIHATPEDQRVSICFCSAIAVLLLGGGASLIVNGAVWAAAGDNAPGEFTFVGASMIMLAAAVCLCILPAQIRDHCRRSDEPAVDDNEWPDWGKNPKAPTRAAVKPDPEKPVQSL